jgi:uncharacterized protein YcbK (DUF882 family)
MKFCSANSLRAPLAATALLVIVPACAAPPSVPAPREHRVRFFHTHTRERLDIVYRAGDRYLPEALARLNHYLRDHRTGDARPYDPRVFDLLHDLLSAVGKPDAEIDVICGYRTPRSNDYLRRKSAGVAKGSLHLEAMAIDIRVSGVATARLRDAALGLRRGGVGYYGKTGFIHVDVGRVRRW